MRQLIETAVLGCRKCTNAPSDTPKFVALVCKREHVVNLSSRGSILDFSSRIHAHAVSLITNFKHLF